jgi:hypothetical protein
MVLSADMLLQASGSGPVRLLLFSVLHKVPARELLSRYPCTTQHSIESTCAPIMPRSCACAVAVAARGGPATHSSLSELKVAHCLGSGPVKELLDRPLQQRSSKIVSTLTCHSP